MKKKCINETVFGLVHFALYWSDLLIARFSIIHIEPAMIVTTWQLKSKCLGNKVRKKMLNFINMYIFQFWTTTKKNTGHLSLILSSVTNFDQNKILNNTRFVWRIAHSTHCQVIAFEQNCSSQKHQCNCEEIRIWPPSLEQTVA